jgi:2,3-bisphosphoglycerate-dependent phosphoglycerate mutase
MLIFAGTPYALIAPPRALALPPALPLPAAPLQRASAILMKSKAPGTLILLRHGATEVSSDSAFIGWSDPDLSKYGEQQTAEAARALLEAGYSCDICFTSLLKRSVRSTWILLQALEKIHLPVYKHWRLNERCYGALTGERTEDLVERYGEDTIADYRRSFTARPPAFGEDHRFNPKYDVRYDRWQDKHGKIRPVALPNGESMGEAIARVLPAWKRAILPELRKGKNVLVVAHGNTIRSIVQSIDGLSDEQTCALEVPRCIPLVYRFERKSAFEAAEDAAEGLSDWVAEGPPGGLRPLAGFAASVREKFKGRRQARSLRSLREGPRSKLSNLLGRTRKGYSSRDLDLVPIVHDASATPLSGEFLAKPARIEEAQEEVRVASLSRYGIGINVASSKGSGGGYGAFFEQSSYCDVAKDEGGVSDGGAARSAAAGPAAAEGGSRRRERQQQEGARTEPLQLPGGGTMARSDRGKAERRPQHVVIIRHGKTGHNKLGLFTGWEDVSLADEGRGEATKAGEMLRRHGVRFDVVYTSWLQRAIETAWLVLDELDALWLPIHKSWRLNERMYGSLTGLSKKKIRTVYGQAQFQQWRRSYDTKPPAVSSFSSHYPGNDQRYVDNVVDVRWSVKESVIRSLERGRICLHRKLPRTESLKDCMDRTIPYYVNAIESNDIKQGKSVLIASSENAIRGLLMHLLDIPKEEIIKIEIPTGLPLVFDMRYKCLSLLEGDFSDYNFGEAAELLFTPCTIPDEEFDELEFETNENSVAA